MAEPCCKCGSEATGRDYGTPTGICEACACAECRGFRVYDCRGFLYSGTWPSLTFTNCTTCNGSGLRTDSATPKDGAK